MPFQSRRRDFVTGLAASLALPAAAAPLSTGWNYYGGDQQATHYSPLTQITRDNVSQLKVAWVHHGAAADSRYRGSVECTPLVIDGIMYIIGADLVIQALDAASGKLLWTHTPAAAPGSRAGRGVSRGLTYWKTGSS